MNLISKIFWSKEKGLSKVKSQTYICKWCDYKVYPGEFHNTCEELKKRYKCKVCTYPVKPGIQHKECREYLESSVQKHAFCLKCKKVCIPGKPHKDCNFLILIERAEICSCCGFKILGLEHKYCKRFTVIR